METATEVEEIDDELEVLDDEKEYEASEGARLCIGFSWSLVQFIWGLFLLSVAIVKIVENSFLDYIRHFTNVSWTWQIFFILATSPGPLLIALRLHRPLKFVILVIAIVLMPLFGIVVAVAIIIFILIGTDAEAITDAFRNYPPEQVMIANDIYHVVPFIELVIFIGLWGFIVFVALNYGLQTVHYETIAVTKTTPTRNGRSQSFVVRERRVVRRHLSIPLFIYQAYAGPLIPILFYIAVFDPREVYGTDMSYLAGFSLLFVALTISNAIPLLIAIYAFGLGSRAITIEHIYKRRRRQLQIR